MQKLHLACKQKKDETVYTPWQSYVLLTKECAVATDARILVEHKTDAIFDSYFLDYLNDDDRFLIHRDQWKKMCKNGVVYRLDRDKMIIEVIKKGEVIDIVRMETENESEGLKFPDWEKVIPADSDYDVSVQGVGLRPDLLHRLVQAIYPDSKEYPVFLSFARKDNDGWASDRPIRVKSDNSIYSNDNFIAVIMPYIILR